MLRSKLRKTRPFSSQPCRSWMPPQFSTTAQTTWLPRLMSTLVYGETVKIGLIPRARIASLSDPSDIDASAGALGHAEEKTSLFPASGDGCIYGLREKRPSAAFGATYGTKRSPSFMMCLDARRLWPSTAVALMTAERGWRPRSSNPEAAQRNRS